MAISEELKIILRAQNDTTAAFTALNKNLGDLKATALKVGSVLVSALAIRDVIDQTKEWSEEVRRVQSVTGLAATEASRLAAAARIVGIDTEELNTSLGRLAKNMFSNTVEADKGKDAFAKWHIQVREQSGAFRNINDVLIDVAETVKLLGDSDAATALEMDLFGRSGGRMHELLLRGATGMRELEARADALGVVLGNVTAKQWKAFREDANSLDLAMLGLKVTLGTALLPILTQFVTALTQFVSHVSAAIAHGRVFAMVIKIIGDAIGHTLNLIKQVVDRLGRFIAEVKNIGLAGAIAKLIEDAGKALGNVGLWFSENWPKWLDALSGLAENAGNWMRTDFIPALASGLGTFLPALAAWGLTAAEFLLSDVMVPLNGAAQRIGGQIGATILIAWLEVWRATMGPLLQSLIDRSLNPLIDAINFVIQQMNRIPGVSLPLLARIDVKALVADAEAAINHAARPRIATITPHYIAAAEIGLGAGGLTPGLEEIALGQRIRSTLSRVPAGSEYLASDAAGNPIYRTPGGVIINTGMGGQPFGMAEGGAGVAMRPTLFLAGERGPEPFAFGRGVAGSVVNIYVSGNITESEDDLARRVGAVVMDRLKSFRSLAY